MKPKSQLEFLPRSSEEAKFLDFENFSVLQCVAVCCSVLQCIAVHCSALQCAAVSEESKFRFGGFWGSIFSGNKTSNAK